MAFGMACGDGFECRLQVGEGVHAVDLACLDQRGDAAPSATAFVMTGEQCVLAIKGNRADEVFDVVGVDFDAPVSQEDLQSAPVAVDVGQFLAEAGLGGDAQPLRLKPVSKAATRGADRA